MVLLLKDLHGPYTLDYTYAILVIMTFKEGYRLVTIFYRCDAQVIAKSKYLMTASRCVQCATNLIIINKKN